MKSLVRYVLKTQNKSEIINEVTKVTFGDLSDEAIAYYLENYKPFDKAGSYGIQDWIGLIGISRIEGSYTNVVGLPTEKSLSIFVKILTKRPPILVLAQ